MDPATLHLLKETKALVVEDDPSLGRLIQIALRRFGARVTIATTGDEALRHLERELYLALACDVGLPDRSGLDVIALAREMNPSMGIVAITGLADVEVAVASMKAGGDDFLAKPFDPTMLWHILEKALDGRQRRIEAEQASIYRRLAYTNVLTDCPNRRFIEEELAMAAGRAEQDGSPLTVAFLDIDNFKLFNDTLGHTRGDSILCQVADALRRTVKPPATYGRFGGDEFVAFFPGLPVTGAAAIMERLRREVAGIEVFSDSNLALVTGFSYGLASAAPGYSAREIIAQAEEQMYLDKSGAAGKAPDSSQDGLPAITNLRALRSLVKAIDRRDAYTRYHSDHATNWALRVAGRLGLKDEQLNALAIGGPIHDLGKIVVPDEILRKPGALSLEERAQMQEHSVIGAAITSAVTDADAVVNLVRHHHERFDGGGYPGNLSCEEIPFPTRLFTLADAYSAMTTDRPYRKGLTPWQALEEIERHAGTQFDPDLAGVFVDVISAEYESRASAA